VPDLDRHYLIAAEKFLCTQAGDLVLLGGSDLRRLALKIDVQHKVHRDSYGDIYVASVAQVNLPGAQWLGLRQLLDHLTEAEFQMAGRALQIMRWHFDHQFCSRCGQPTEQHSKDIAKACINCAIDFYPRLSPCIITLVTRGDECLLAWHTRSTEEKYSCLAGFIEVGESPEQTLEREVKEEVGINVSNIRYVASQPWPFPGQLMLGYFADYSHGDLQIDKEEIVVARWYRYDRLPKVPPNTTISGRLIDKFVQERLSLK